MDLWICGSVDLWICSASHKGDDPNVSGNVTLRKVFTFTIYGDYSQGRSDTGVSERSTSSRNLASLGNRHPSQVYLSPSFTPSHLTLISGQHFY